MKKAFTLVEVMIVVAILGILAAIVLPLFQSNVTEAKEAAAKDNLRILRNAIELYAARHDGVPPGYLLDKVATNPHYVSLKNQLLNGYLPKLPANPFNGLQTVKVMPTGSDFPEQPTGTFGWIYCPSMKAVRLDWPGTDSKGMPYYNY